MLYVEMGKISRLQNFKYWAGQTEQWDNGIMGKHPFKKYERERERGKEREREREREREGLEKCLL